MREKPREPGRSFGGGREGRVLASEIERSFWRFWAGFLGVRMS